MKLSTLLIVCALAITPYIWNGFKFIDCDFESDYKCEVIHGAGVFIPPAAFVTVWFDSDNQE